MTDPIRDALDWLNQRLLPTLFGEGVDATFLQSWASHARAALAAQPPVGNDDDRAALQGLLDRVHLAATDPAAWLGLKQGDGQSPADAPPPAPEGDPIRAVLEQLIDRMMNERASSATVDAWAAEARAICAALDAQPPAPAASTTPDLDALLSPEGAYEGGTGQEDGAQLVSGPHGPEWWAPLYGCDTLDNLLDQLRARILPYLRPPVAGIDVPGPDGDYGGLQELCAAEGVAYSVGVPLLKRAQQAWRQTGRLHALQQEVHRFREPERTILCDILTNGGLLPDPEGRRYGMPPAPYVRPLAIEAGDAQQGYRSWLTYFEVGGNCGGGAKLSQENCRSLAALLRSLSPTLLRQPAPAVLPVPVAERPWEREEWCDAQGRCWWSHGPTPTARWSLLPMDGMDDARGWLLPHWAIPIPQRPLGGEVA